MDYRRGAEDFSVASASLRCLRVSKLTLRRVIAFFVAHLQLVRLAIMIHIEVRNFHAQFVQLAIGLSHFWNKSKAVLISQVCADGLIDVGILTLESRKPGRAAGRLSH